MNTTKFDLFTANVATALGVQRSPAAEWV